MIDIAKCKGTDCLIREGCYRFTAKVDYHQLYFIDIPFEIEDGKFTCQYFWDERAKQLLTEIKDITNGLGD